MARIHRAQTKSFRIGTWLGLNEAPDGDSKLKYGEAVLSSNWRITRDGNLCRRPGTKTAVALTGNAGGNYEVRCLWSGRVASNDVLLAAADGALWLLSDSLGTMAASSLGSITTTGRVSIFGFDGKAYILTGSEYKVWDGTSLSSVAGYVPIVSVAVPPSGGGTLLEQVNKLTASRRCRFSPDGTATVFQLPEKGVESVDSVTDLTTGEPITGFSSDVSAGTVTFTSAPSTGVSTIEVAWTGSTSFESQVTGMRFAEFYNGTADNRVFLYGDGSNKLLYSGIDYDGNPRADYFPDLNEIAVGTSNTPVTGAVKHYSRLIVFKPSETYTVAYGTTTLADGTVTPVFYLSPVNRSLGNDAPGQVQLVLNSARSLCSGAVYEWKNNSSYTSNLTVDERQAKLLSGRVSKTLSGFDPSSCVCWDDNAEQEYYIVCGATALVHNYVNDVWYTYIRFPATAFARHGGNLYIGDNLGNVKRVSTVYSDDDGVAIDAYWESGSIDFGAYTREKYFAELWAEVSPLGNGKMALAAKTDRGEEVASAVTTPDNGDSFDFGALDFSDTSFDYDRISIARKLRLRIRKFTFCKLCFQANDTDSNAAVSSVSVNVVYGGESRQGG